MDAISMCTTFVVFRFAHFKHKQGDAKNKRGLHDPNHAPYMPGGLPAMVHQYTKREVPGCVYIGLHFRDRKGMPKF